MLNIITYIIAGLGAGVGTGLAGLSAAAVISPMLIVLAGVDPYEAVAIALASDVLASLFSAITYAKNKNIDIKNGIVMLIFVLLFTMVGSYAASLVSGNLMGGFSVIMTLLLGINFLVKPVTKSGRKKVETGKLSGMVKSALCGILVGFICGFVGAGGGMMMLLVLTSVLGYELKVAVGTSVFIMTFTAFTGACSHMAIQGITNITALVVCVIFTLIGAIVSAKYANKAEEKTLNKVTGITLVILGLIIIGVKLFS